jgi:hypothetical protein
LPAHGDVETAFEKALYDKARYQTLSRLNDQDFVAYCVTMNLGGETLLRIHDEVMARQAERQNLIDEGQTNDSPKVAAIDIELKILGTQYAIKIGEARKGLEIEANIADSTLSALSQTQK